MIYKRTAETAKVMASRMNAAVHPAMPNMSCHIFMSTMIPPASMPRNVAPRERKLTTALAVRILFLVTRLGTMARCAALKKRANRNITKTTIKTGYILSVMRKSTGISRAHTVRKVSQTTRTVFLCQRSTSTPAIGPKINTGSVINIISWESSNGTRSFGNNPMSAMSAI
ncbi:hypothetical protein AMJ83_00230 [candidate division WOR_3 bacterium SM23_42]|uniref:Uncharacterized protein n=1 Tax=candidate division WOR_3 bacterium SM23_42 TaxID=1703779 RepID=A0A0S8FVT9_UNCW3|nr:MAG: hypothetical protein AMJ83_00230 [candidate division WOR_3 bacterium SM23_42]